MNVLSLFNGMGCIWLALDRLGIQVDKRYCSEIDKYANIVNDANYPDSIHLGDVRKVNVNELEPIQLLVGGSPCQGFSFAGKMLNFEDERSKLFFEYVRILNEVKQKNPDVLFLLENVRMKREHEMVISKYLGVEPILINSAKVSAQNRERLYWFGQSRERLFFNDYSCYICRKKENEQKKQSRLLGETQGERKGEILGETQKRHSDLHSLRSGISKNGEKGNNEDMLINLSGCEQKTNRQKSLQGEKIVLPERVFLEKQGKTFGLPETIQADKKGEGNCKKIRTEPVEENGEINEDSFTSSTWNEEEARKRRIDYHSKYGKEVCCVQCGERLDYRPHHSIVTWGDKRIEQFTSPMSEMQFNEARQNNGRVFDTYKIGLKGLQTLFGETIADIKQPKDRGILLKDVLQPENEVNERYHLSEAAMNRILKYQHENNWSNIDPDKAGTITLSNTAKLSNCPTLLKLDVNGVLKSSQEKASCETAGGHSAGNHSDMDVIAVRGAVKFGRTDEAKQQRRESMKSGKDHTPFQAKEIVGIDPLKMNCITAACSKDNVLFVNQRGRGFNKGGEHHEKSPTVSSHSWQNNHSVSNYRRLTPIEVERLFNIPDNYTAHVSDSQRYKMLGNGWEIETIAHILKHMPNA